jgi:hypothetical protein|tara:strand:+ start:235 stop:366 length:132 start_codon:yes stop_codon:yes gene_type:complete
MAISRASIPRELIGNRKHKKIKTATISKGKKILSKNKPRRKKV